MKKLKAYKKQLRKAGFSEAELKPYRFFRAETEKTAFIINLTETEHGLGVLYGFCSTSFMTGDDDFFRKYGKDETDCNLRYFLTIKSDEDESEAKELIEGLYILYSNTEKDELLSIVKERRKAFLQKFTTILKPLGFRKKGNKWSKPFADEYILTIEAQKSAYSDQYYFNISIDKEYSQSVIGCYCTRVDTNPQYIYNWQIMSDTEMDALLAKIEEQTKTILNTSIETLGKQKWIWANCMCNRKHCHNCWVEKNLGEAKE